MQQKEAECKGTLKKYSINAFDLFFQLCNELILSTALSNCSGEKWNVY